MAVPADWLTQREAAELLGVHKSAVPKMIRRGDLTPRRGLRPSLSRREVLALARERASAEAERQQRRAAPSAPRLPQPPSEQYEWLSSDEAAAMFGISRQAVMMRARRGRVPSVMHDGRRWFRRDHLDLVLHAREASSLLKRTAFSREG